MTKIKRKVLVLFMAITLCLGSIAGFAKNAVSARASTTDELIEVGACILDDKFSIDIVTHVEAELGSNYHFEHIKCESDDSEQQSAAIEYFISVPVDILFIIPVEEAGDIASALWKAYEAGITIIVMGDVNESYPPEIIYFVHDYYKMGRQHAESILSNLLQNPDSLVHFYYFNDENGNQYMQGVESVLGEFTNVKCIPVNDLSDVENSVVSWFGGKTEDEEIDIILTYATEIAECIIELYRLEGYNDASSGTMIGIFSYGGSGGNDDNDNDDNDNDEYEVYLNQLAQLIVSVLDNITMGETVDNIIDYDFVPGYAKYVSRFGIV